MLKEISFELRSRTHNIFSSPLADKIVYIHIPKCGGVSISKALKGCYVNWDVRDKAVYNLDSVATLKVAEQIENKSLYTQHPTVTGLRENLLMYAMAQQDIRFINGHFMFSNLAYNMSGHDFHFVTMLRNPVDKWISAYFYNRHKSYGNSKTDLPLEEYLDSPAAYRSGQSCVRFLYGKQIDDQDSVSTEQLLENAKKNLHCFKLVGAIEHLDTFLEQFSHTFGRRLDIGTWNRNPKSKSHQRSLITPQVYARIEDLCQPDTDLYNYAIDNLILKH
ncbi:sulfotransferase family 2 domain-containing protein [Leptothoe spongobia]|uniref:Sulfotransferase family 2 domain-containing protein n=1 Tax=Leptothoe spongobia TAU-MAC 1115 TaxID=1967444 RepID=A0A947GLR8_9CYAN|nr:sulfotransferase family 2 domain-containing protein [Leptothoe spongobia]MBT9317202.1 sulfotransferase family 2 domain-containing protein [Leptothoe spongobia TAU-MAC 1115]